MEKKVYVVTDICTDEMKIFVNKKNAVNYATGLLLDNFVDDIDDDDEGFITYMKENNNYDITFNQWVEMKKIKIGQDAESLRDYDIIFEEKEIEDWEGQDNA